MTTFGDQVFQHGGAAVSGPLSTGPAVYIKPGTGSDGHRGNRPDRSVKTLAKAQTLMPADKNGVIYLISEDNSASGTTARIEGATFTFSNDGTKLVGIASGGMIGSRARISNTAAAANVTPLMSWSASNSAMANISVQYFEADADDLGCFDVTGERNYFYRCHFAGIGDDLQDNTGAYSLKVTGDENLFEECVIGIDTIGSGSAVNSEILFSGTATRNIFKNCIINTWAQAAAHQFVTFGAAAIDRFVLFDNCTFINAGAVEGPGNVMTEAFSVNAAPGGNILLKDCALFGSLEWDASDSGFVEIVGASGIAATSGIGIEPAV